MNNQEKILEQFFLYPTRKFHIRELAKLVKLNPNTIINISNKLIKKKLIIRKKPKPLVYLYANSEHKNFIINKKLYNIKKLYSTEIVDYLIEFYNAPEAIVVIGSYARGEDHEKSDVDIIIITNSNKIPKTLEYSRKIARKIHILALNYKDMSKEFYINLINGIKLNGYIREK